MWHWEYLTIQNFQWIYGSTPMSDLSVIYTSWVVYFIGILSIRWYMAERTRIEKSHKGILSYNASMILCSICVWCLSSWFLWQLIHTHLGTFCHAPEHPLFNTHGKYMLYSMYLCYLLRFYAFLDTVILALRKKSIPFLHWYQHMFVILMMWSWLQDQSIFGR
ncbi:ELO family [Gilbertella persicaria]|uniref:ELO family n=1 Tax=Gilbertella persicaria TaxID=101096 RepID=UPI0022204BD9|nr:ELO family [Gilbertella persicaria]KAI8057527.1 ELO family [Gilbertella persicaria]